MVPYESEIPKELEQGATYTASEVLYFVQFNRYVTVITDDMPMLQDRKDIKYKVERRIEAHTHINDGTGYSAFGGTRRVYILERLY